mgnify:CR=1 FL=1
MNKVNFMQRLSQTFTQMGAGLTQTAMTGLALHSMNHCCSGPSIFGFGCFNGVGYGMGMNYGFGITPQMMADPMGFTWLPNPMNMYAQNNNYGNMIASQYGYALGLQARAAAEAKTAAMPQNQQLPKTNAEYAGDIDENQETESGRAFNNATNDMSTNKKAKDFNIINSYTDPNNNAQCVQEYKAAVTNLAKSYAADIDSTGNKDRKVTAEEFVNYELSKLDSNATNEDKKRDKQMALNAFNKIDQNGDGLADWKELAATIATLDTTTDSTNEKATQDGTISVKDFSKWSTLLGQQGTNAFDTTVRNSYKQLFDE